MAGEAQILQQMLAFKGAVAITPNDTTLLALPARGLYVGGGGTVSALLLDGTTVTFSGMVAGTIYSLRIKRVNSTGTTATLLLALY